MRPGRHDVSGQTLPPLHAQRPADRTPRRRHQPEQPSSSQLRPLFDSLAGRDKPSQALLWVGKPHVSALLRALGTGDTPLTHEAFSALQPKASAEHLRSICIDVGLLAARDHQVVLFERWWHDYLPTITEPAHARLVGLFVAWEVAARLRRRAANAPLTPDARYWASDQVRRAVSFLTWLDEHEVALEVCTQSDVDRWHAEHPAHQRNRLRAFLLWAQTTKKMPTRAVPAAQTRTRPPISAKQRRELTVGLLENDEVPLRPRVAALLGLLYAQPLSRITRLRVDDIHTSHDGEVLLSLGKDPTPVPALFAALLLQLAQQRTHVSTATNPSSPWLFPGRLAGQPMHSHALGAELTRHGLPPRTTGRTAALRELVQHAPASLVADALGIHPITALRHRTNAGRTWAAYPGLERSDR